MVSDGYDLSPIFHTNLLAFSPGSSFLATFFSSRLIIRSTSTLAIVRSWLLLPPSPSTSASAGDIAPDQLLWSPDGLYVLAFSSKLAVAWVFGLAEEGNGESGEIALLRGDGVEGCVRVEWGKGGREILAWSEHGLRVTIYDLSTGEASYIQYPKSPNNCHSYSPEGRYFAIAERHSGKDHIGVYDVHAGYTLLRHFPLYTHDVQSISWSPCGMYIAAFDSTLHYAVALHSPLGPVLSRYDASTWASSGSYSTPHPSPTLGIRQHSWSACGRYLLLGGYDSEVRVMESETGRCVGRINTPARIADANMTAWQEPKDWMKDTRGRGIVAFNRIHANFTLPSARPGRADPLKPLSQGVLHLALSPSSSHFFTQLSAQPSVIHVYSFLPAPAAATPDIQHTTSIVLQEGVKSAKWVADGRIAIVRGGSDGGLCFWDASGGWEEEGDSIGSGIERSGRGDDGFAEGVGVPSHFWPGDLITAPDGSALALLDKDKRTFCLVYDSGDNVADRTWDEAGAEGGLEGLSRIGEEEEGPDRWAGPNRQGWDGRAGVLA